MMSKRSWSRSVRLIEASLKRFFQPGGNREDPSSFPRIGQRYRLQRIVSRQEFDAPAGMTGKIKKSEQDEIVMEMDQPLPPELQNEWGNCLQWHRDDDPHSSLLDAFFADCELTKKEAS